VVPTYRTIRQHIAKEKGHITEHQENVTSHQQDLTKQKQVNSVYVGQCTHHEHKRFMKTTHCNTKMLAHMMVGMKKGKMCPVPEKNQGSE
jgi:hypothetical protein